MARRLPLPDKLKEKARSSLYPVVYSTPQGELFAGLLPSEGEPDEFYLRRVWHMRPVPGGRPVNIDEFLSLPPPEQTQARAQELKAWILHMLNRIADSLVDSGERFLAAAEDADPERLATLAAQGAPVNYHDPRNGLTALHYVAAQGARRAFRALLKIGGLDFLARDDQGRLASEMAGAYGRNLAMERLLFRKEIQQARVKGIPLEQLYQRDAAPRSAPSNP